MTEDQLQWLICNLKILRDDAMSVESKLGRTNSFFDGKASAYVDALSLIHKAKEK